MYTYAFCLYTRKIDASNWCPCVPPEMMEQALLLTWAAWVTTAAPQLNYFTLPMTREEKKEVHQKDLSLIGSEVNLW